MSDGQFTILAADDELSIHRLVQAALDGHGYRLVEAHNGDEALEKALLDRPDMVILDVMDRQKIQLPLLIKCLMKELDLQIFMFHLLFVLHLGVLC